MQIAHKYNGLRLWSGPLGAGLLICALLSGFGARAFAEPPAALSNSESALAKPAIALTNVKFINSTIFVSTQMSLDAKSLEDIKRGVGKELVFYVDLYRVWDNWPDEFVLGIAVSHSLRCDPLKREYTLTTTRGNTSLQRRFASCEELLSTCLTLTGEVLTSTGALPEASYYVKASAESRLRELPPFVDLLFFFVKESEYTVEARSESFAIMNTGMPR